MLSQLPGTPSSSTYSLVLFHYTQHIPFQEKHFQYNKIIAVPVVHQNLQGTIEDDQNIP
ncbi:hypothetical protein ACE6H2_015266 [Prunus campanulata]